MIAEHQQLLEELCLRALETDPVHRAVLPIAVILEQSRGALVYMLSTRTWCCSQSTPPLRRVTGRPLRLPEPKATPATPSRYWIFYCVIANGYAHCSRIPWRLVCCTFLWKNAGRRSMTKRARASV